MKIVSKIAAKLPVIAACAVSALAPIATAVAEEAATAAASSLAPLGAGLAIGMAVVGGALGQGRVVGSMLESFGRNPSVGGKLLTPMILGMALIESLVILAFVIAFRM
ncbi:MAG: ATP synthase F0 subunit C [Pseudomonadota bacterium]|jgi:F-type H+-transporting ATPase subunit c